MKRLWSYEVVVLFSDGHVGPGNTPSRFLCKQSTADIAQDTLVYKKTPGEASAHEWWHPLEKEKLQLITLLQDFFLMGNFSFKSPPLFLPH